MVYFVPMGISFIVLILLVVVVTAFAAVWQQLRRQDARVRDQWKAQFTELAQETLKQSNEQFLQLAQERFSHEQTKAQADMAQNTQSIEKTMEQTNKAMADLSKLVQDFEKDRDKKYGSLQTQLQSAMQGTSQLQETTNKLTAVLANVKLRGQWGERMADDILRVSGLMENVHYRKNRTQDTSVSRPDYVFLLPDQWKVAMDVKFPLDNYMALVNTEDESRRKGYQSEFIRDVKDRLKEITKRDYISLDEQTLDYVILFIPNEQVYGFIHEAAPGLLDEAMKQRIVLCSPFTLYAILAVIRQAFEHFHFREAAHEILKMVTDFRGDFEKFKGRFEDLGKQLGKATNKYQEITDKSYKRLDQRVRKIEEYRKGQNMPEKVPPGPEIREEKPVGALADQTENN